MIEPNDAEISPPDRYMFIGHLTSPLWMIGWVGLVWQSSIRMGFPVLLKSSA